jgi:hypothetical protein
MPCVIIHAKRAKLGHKERKFSIVYSLYNYLVTLRTVFCISSVVKTTTTIHLVR